MGRASFGSELIRSLALLRRWPNHCGLVAIIAAGVFATFVMAETPPPGQSGIEGVISVSPNRPGPKRIGVSDVAPAPNVRFIVKRGDAAVGSFVTDGQGGFRIELAPGHYIVMRDDPGAAIGHWRFEADVTPKAMTKVHWTGDSGMR